MSLMTALDPLLLARIQFAFTISFHIVFPALTIGLASYLAVLEALWLRTGRQVFLDLYNYWLRIFAIAFGMGVVSGIVMSYQFGTNWGPFAEATGPVLGPLLAYEVLTAFFLEAGFLGVMLFGMNRVGPRLHFAATVLVAVGTLISAFWILAASSWMHTPAGFAIEGARYVPVDWWAVVFNPSFPYRFVHMTFAAYLTTAFVVAAVGGWHLLRNPHDGAAATMFLMAVVMAVLLGPAQLVVGDLHGLNTKEHQPAKVAAMEGHFESRARAPAVLFGLPDMEAGRLDAEIGIPGLGSLILEHDIDAPVTGLDAFPRSEWPHVPVVFWAFRVMVGLGLLMILFGAVGALLALRRRLLTRRWFLRWAVVMGPSGFVALLAGWFVTEAGRQPWVVYGLMRTADAASPIGAPGVATSLLAIVVVYLLVFGAGIFYLLRLMNRPPRGGGHPQPDAGPLRAAAGWEGLFGQMPVREDG